MWVKSGFQDISKLACQILLHSCSQEKRQVAEPLFGYLLSEFKYFGRLLTFNYDRLTGLMILTPRAGEVGTQKGKKVVMSGEVEWFQRADFDHFEVSWSSLHPRGSRCYMMGGQSSVGLRLLTLDTGFIVVSP